MKTLFPEIEPYKISRLRVSPVHELYIEEVGNPLGEPILYLHGGPGTGVSAKRRRFFDPKHYRIILFDQRGAGKSTPQGCLDENTTWHLVEDIEKIRLNLCVDKWIIFGGSWGSTLALAYAETHPLNCAGLILNGIFLCRKREIDWFYQSGCDLLFPDLWEDYIKIVPPDERGNMLAAYNKRLTSTDSESALAAADAWNRWEGSTLELIISQQAINALCDPRISLARARIENHFFHNKSFLKSDDQLLRDALKLRNIPGVLIHGRYDVVCPVINAWDLSRAWPEAHLEIIADAGHSAFEPGMTDALLHATEKFKNLTKK
jgi:proline iminopeptidase